MAIGRLPLYNGHEIDHLPDPVRAQETRDQDRGVGEVELPADIVVPVGPDAEVPAAVVVEQGCEDAWGVETGTAEPIEGAVCTDQGCRLQVAYKAVLTNCGITIHSNAPSSRSCFLFAPAVHDASRA